MVNGDSVKNISYGDTVSFEKKRHVDSGFSHVCSKKGFLKFESLTLESSIQMGGVKFIVKNKNKN